MKTKSFNHYSDFFRYHPTTTAGFKVIMIGETKSQIRNTISSMRRQGSTQKVPDYNQISPLERELILKTRPKAEFCPETNLILVIRDAVQLLVHPSDYRDLTSKMAIYETRKMGDLFHFPTPKVQWLLPERIIGQIQLDLIEEKPKELAEKYFERTHELEYAPLYLH